MNKTYIVGGILLIVGFVGGYMYGDGDYSDTRSGMETSEMEMDEASMDEHAHTHLEVTDTESVPTVSLTVTEDPKSGWNAEIETTNFTFAPENASTAHVPGEGHAHIYVDGVKINRMYGNWYHLGELEPGEHDVRVNLSANDHALLTVDGEEVADTQTVTVSE